MEQNCIKKKNLIIQNTKISIAPNKRSQEQFLWYNYNYNLNFKMYLLPKWNIMYQIKICQQITFLYN